MQDSRPTGPVCGSGSVVSATRAGVGPDGTGEHETLVPDTDACRTVVQAVEGECQELGSKMQVGRIMKSVGGSGCVVSATLAGAEAVRDE